MNESDHKRDNKLDQVQHLNEVPPEWLSIDELEALLFEAIIEESATCNGADGRFVEIDNYFAGPEPLNIGHRRRSVLTLLAILRPLLSDLLGGPLAK